MSGPDPATLLEDVRNSPEGPAVGAFFDFDGTVIAGYSVAAFIRHHVKTLDLNASATVKTLLAGTQGIETEEDFVKFLGITLRLWAGRTPEELEKLGRQLFRDEIGPSVYPESWRLVRAHLERGHTVVLASSATRFQTDPAAKALGIPHQIYTAVEVGEDGRLTGHPDGRSPYGEGKAAAVKDFAAEHGVDLDQSFAYSNGNEDVAFLATVGRPTALNPSAGLRRAAAERGWPAVDLPGRPWTTPLQVARTVGTYAGMMGGFVTGLGLGLVGGSRRAGLNLGIGLGGDLSLLASGVQLDIHGGHHIWEAQPAVFLFNHQSQLDVLVLGGLLRGNFAPVAKKELATNPLFGPLMRLLETAFIDRSDNAQARKALEPAVERLRSGVSVVIAPEGTRSATPSPGTFKKGAFHVARQAGVPVVPLVFRNTGELMSRNAMVIHPGVVQVAVLPPIDVSSWDPSELDERVEEVRQQYLTTLANWPGED
ncbi:HAD-IB family hydrolase [Actinomycetospora atypica]|uniref:HAD-IB family hydrolase n=1 Tax=Actinomycetospora atypica TaxID=1290095 RepID=A0ABV9YRJ0_9PSEU